MHIMKYNEIKVKLKLQIQSKVETLKFKVKTLS